MGQSLWILKQMTTILCINVLSDSTVTTRLGHRSSYDFFVVKRERNPIPPRTLSLWLKELRTYYFLSDVFSTDPSPFVSPRNPTLYSQFVFECLELKQTELRDESRVMTSHSFINQTDRGFHYEKSNDLSYLLPSLMLISSSSSYFIYKM